MYDIDKSKFKNLSGAHLLKPIFFELDEGDRPWAQFTLKNYHHTVDGRQYLSLRRLYVELEDPTEYLFAETYLDGWEHWKKLSGASFFQSYLKDWREELEIRLRAKALLRIKKKAEEGTKDSLQADKTLLMGGWKTEEEKSAGRPSKKKIQEEADKLMVQKTEYDNDFERLTSLN